MVKTDLIRLAKTKALISFAVTAYAESRFSHDAANLYLQGLPWCL